ncbi:nuclear receptor-binding protein [Hetaerina americana]|uniref:nuclear receptor-binding protein n=1 Tax=Hetaerina americana TaxID=62018 RepID=UPI003A7F5047
MPGSRSSNDQEHKSPRESGEDSEDESEILEESPCGRWLKRREEVEQRDVPGIDCAYLAMDTEEGVEVVWNEVQFSERKNFKAQEEKIRAVFENLTRLEHPNIVKFHRYWTDTHDDKPRVIFITEYMSSGSLKQFLKRTKRNVKRLPLTAWKRWCTQILSALSYLHSCSPAIVHANLTCDTIFIQHNGLVKIGSVAPDAIHQHVKTCREKMKSMHFLAPEYGTSVTTPPMDIYSFGICALEMAALEIQGNGDSGSLVTEDHINRTIEALEDPSQRDFIRRCLKTDPRERPGARELLFHPLLFEVHSLKLLAAHALVRRGGGNGMESVTEEVVQRVGRGHSSAAPPVPSPSDPSAVPLEGVLAEIRHPDGRPGVAVRAADVPVSEKLEKFVEDVRYGIYPLTAFSSPIAPPPPLPSSTSPPPIPSSMPSSVPPSSKPSSSLPTSSLMPPDDSNTGGGTPRGSEGVGGGRVGGESSGEKGGSGGSDPPVDVETRRVVNMMCSIKPKEEESPCSLLMTVLLRFDDKMNRQLTCPISEQDDSTGLANELVHFGFINELDRARLAGLMDDSLLTWFGKRKSGEERQSTLLIVTGAQTAVADG